MGGGPSKQETQQQQQSWANLNQVFQSALGAGQPFGQAGKQTLDTVTNYFKTLLGGGREQAMKMLEPAANAATAAADTQKKQQATMGTGRTGGTAAGNQQIDENVRKQIDDLIATITSQVPQQAATQLENIGENEVNAMMNALGLGTQATGTAGSLVGSDINARRQSSAQMWGSLFGGAASLATAPLGGTGPGQFSTLIGKI